MQLLNFPDMRQVSDFDCGASAVQSVLAYYGFDIDEAKIMKKAKTTHNGTHPHNMVRVLKSYGLSAVLKKMTLAEVREHLRKKVPVILLLQAWTAKKDVDWEKDWDDGHYAVAIGYYQEKFIFDDPKSVLRTYLSANDLKKRWHDVGEKGKKYVNYGIVVQGGKHPFSLRKIIPMP